MIAFISLTAASMTTFATRAPLQQILNPHMMSEPRENGRRSSKRLEQKEDAMLVNGIGHENEPPKNSKSDGVKQMKGRGTGAAAKSAVKRKPGEHPVPRDLRNIAIGLHSQLYRNSIRGELIRYL